MNTAYTPVRSSAFWQFFPRLGSLLLCTLLLALPPDSAAAKSKAKPRVPQSDSHHFFAFSDAPYYTSPDQRIGAKLMIDSARVGPTLSALQHLTYLPGAHVKPHRHVYVTEVIYVLKGNLTLRIGQETKVMGPDTTAYIPPQTFHEYRNDSGDVVQFLQFYSPSGPEEEYRNWERPGDKPAAKSDAKAAEPPREKNVVRGPLPPIPGSPLPRLQRVDERTLEGSPSTTSVRLTPPPPVEPPTSPLAPGLASPAAGLQLKTRFERIAPALPRH